jgi:hypothetical protein
VFSDAIELLGLACLVAGVFVFLGLGWALLAACPCLLVVGYVTDDEAVKRAVARQRARVRHAAGAPARRVRARSAKTRTA